MALLGDDGRGYELARKLESCGVWRSWLGDSYYSSFIHFLSSPSSWESFMRVDNSKSKSQIHLQLRARALLYDKAAVSLFLPSNHNSSSVSVAKLNPNYLQLHGDDLYFTLESSSQDGVQQRESGASGNMAPSKNSSKSAFAAGSKFGESEYKSSQRYRNEELPETWYDQFIEKYRVIKPYKLLFGDRESDKRTPEEMSTYLRILERHKRRRVAFLDDMGVCNSADDDVFFPEIMFTWNCVPDTALSPIIRSKISQRVDFKDVLDTWPQVMTRSPVMIERLGIRPEYLGMEQGGNFHRGKNGSEGNKKDFGEEQASQISQKAIARMLTGMGFEGATEVPLEVLSELMSRRICKFGRILKVLSDSYRKQCSAIELLRMFLQAAGYSNFGNLAELVKDNTRNNVQQTQQPVQGIQSQMQSPHPSVLRLPQQTQRPMHQQMQNQIVQHPNLTLQQIQQQQLERSQQMQQQQLERSQQMQQQQLERTQQMQQQQMERSQQMQQQQLERMRRRQPSTPRPVMDMEKDRGTVQVKIEASSELPMDVNALNTMNARQSQMQFRHQQLNAMSNLHAQSSNQFRPLTPVQIPQMHSPNMGVVRAPPVKVEGFQELMGGDSSNKHDSDENKLTSPIIKHDCVFGDDLDIDEISFVSEVLKELDRPILYSLSPGTSVTPAMAKEVNGLVNMYRITGDDWDTWGDVAAHFNVSRDFATANMIGASGFRGKSWPDLDMLPLGWLTDPGSNEGPHRTCNLNLAEQRTQMTLWAMARSPLMFGGDVRRLDEITYPLITNPTVLEINSFSSNNKEFPYITGKKGTTQKKKVISPYLWEGSKSTKHALGLTSCKESKVNGWTNRTIDQDLEQVCWKEKFGDNIKKSLCLYKRKPLSASDEEMLYDQQCKEKIHLLASETVEFCLDASPKRKLTAKESKRGSFSPCRREANQMWELNSSGALRNTYSGLCAVVKSVKAVGSAGIRSWIATGRRGEIYLAFFNLNNEKTIISANIADMGKVLPQRNLVTCKGREVWSQNDLGVIRDSISIEVDVHGCALFLLNCR